MTTVQHPITEQKVSDGAAHTIDATQVPRYSESITLTCSAVGDCLTNEAAPIAAELYTVTPPANCVGCEILLLGQPVVPDSTNAELPVARGIRVSIGAGDDAEALARITVPDNGPGDYDAADCVNDMHTLALHERFYRSWAEDAVSRLDIGFLETENAGGASRSNVQAVIEWRVTE